MLDRKIIRMAGFDNESGKPEVKTHEELIEECIEMGIPVIGHEDKGTLEMFLGSADDDFEDEDDFNDDDGFEDGPSDDDEIFDEDFDFDEDDDDDLFEDDDVSYN